MGERGALKEIFIYLGGDSRLFSYSVTELLEFSVSAGPLFRLRAFVSWGLLEYWYASSGCLSGKLSKGFEYFPHDLPNKECPGQKGTLFGTFTA